MMKDRDELWEQVDRMCADGEITLHDADEVRNFASFLEAAGRKRERETPEGRKRFLEAWREHYPEDYAKAVAESKARKAAADPERSNR